MKEIRIQTDSLSIEWECPECEHRVSGGISDLGEGFPLCIKCLDEFGEKEVYMEYLLICHGEKVEEVK